MERIASPARALVVAGVMIAVALSPAAAEHRRGKPKRTERRAEIAYETPVSIGVVEPEGKACVREPNSCADFPTYLSESSVAIEIADASGLPVPAYVEPHTHDGRWGQYFCGTTTEPMPIVPGVEVTVWLNAVDPTKPPCPGSATTGTVRAIFTSRK